MHGPTATRNCVVMEAISLIGWPLCKLYKPDAQLPVEQHREELKESQVGHRVRYLSKHPKEVLDNKKRCEDLMSMSLCIEMVPAGSVCALRRLAAR